MSLPLVGTGGQKLYPLIAYQRSGYDSWKTRRK